MSTQTPVATEVPPPVSGDVWVSDPDKDGISVVKNQRKQRYMRVGPEEAFLLSLLDGNTTFEEIISKFEERFGETISEDDVQQFVGLAKKEGLLRRSTKRNDEADARPQGLVELVRLCIRQAKKQSPLFFRVKLYDPDETLNWLEPKTRWLFSAGLTTLASVAGALAILIVCVDRGQLVQQFTLNFGWQAFALAWLTTIAITVCHEFGHGLACKRYGGDVNEMGALWIFFTPCFYCNVSDAWMLHNRWQRLLISLAGTYIDFLVWIVAVFVWRLTALDTAVNFVAWVVVSTCGLRVAFNLFPLMRLDGYYALCDLLGIHNLRKRARAYYLGHVRWLMWGARKPQRESEHATLLAYGSANWIFTVGFLGFMSFQASLYLRSLMGIGSIIAAVGFFSVLTRKYFKGSLGEDFRTMFHARKARVAVLLLLIVGVLAIPVHDRAGGEFHVRPVIRREVRAPIAGFLKQIKADEGDVVATDSMLVFIEVPELTSNIARKKAEIAESQANLRRLRSGPRSEEILDQKERIRRATSWRDLAISDLEKARASFVDELESLNISVQKANAEVDYYKSTLQQMQTLFDRGGLAGQQLLNYKKRHRDAELELSRSKAAKRSRAAEGLISYESELARRNKELADAQAALALLEAGFRVEDIDAEQARLARLQEELQHLNREDEKQLVRCPVSGTIVTPRLREKIGTYVERGTPLCIIEDLENLEAEIAVSEKDARVLVKGQPIRLKPRSLPFQTLTATVERIAPAAQTDVANTKRTVTVYCSVDNSDGLLRTGMTGFGRIRYERHCLGMLMYNAGIRLLRTEFFW